MNAVVNNPAIALANEWQRGFPLCPQPYAEIAASAGMTTVEVLELMQSLADQAILARIGVTVRPNTAGASTLAAMAVPHQRLNDTAALVSEYPAVNHNYEREHDINLWFVVTAADRAEVSETLRDIAQRSGIEVLDLPLERSYHIDLGFRLSGKRQKVIDRSSANDNPEVDDEDRSILAAVENGLELVDRPYLALARKLGWNEDRTIERMRSLISRGIVSRFGCILRHRRLGFRANAMSVWDVPDSKVDCLAELLAQRDEVTLCYRRSRRLPVWPYNLFAMVHGCERAAVLDEIAEAARAVGLDKYPSSILFSRRCFKQSVARLSPGIKGAA